MIKQLKNGKWWLYTIDEYGEKVRITFDKKSDAEAKERRIKERIYDFKLTKTQLRKSRYSFDKALKDFESSKADLRPGTQKRYRSILQQLKYFVEAMGLKYVDEFSPDHATILLNELTKARLDPKGNTDKIVKANNKTINMYIQVTKAFFRDEQNKGHIKDNPVIHLRNLRVEKKKPEYYTDEELKRFFSEPMPEDYRNFFFGLLQTGMRYAELANLTWKDVDFERMLIHVRSSERFKTKTYKSERAIPMTNDMQTLLKQLEEKGMTELVFTTRSGTQIKERKALALCKSVAQKANIKSNAFLHKFRHTYATILVQRGERLEDIKELLGHSSITETEIYAHHRPDQLHDKVTHLDNLIDFNIKADQE